MSQSKRSSKDRYLDSLKKRYAKASKKERGKILDEYVQTTGYHRQHAIANLSGQYQPAQRPIRRPRKSFYTVEDAKALDFLSDLFGGINAKRLRAAMDVELDGLYQRGVLQVSRACVAVRNKAQKYVFEAIRLARRRLPFPLLGVDSDNGSEFINDELFRYCRDEHITFTRGRSGHKNDNAYVEKNWSAVRRFVGDLRYDTSAQLELLNPLYERLHLYLNFFIPVMKLKEKVRTGSEVKRVYDQPQTPYARVLASADVSAKIKTQLRAQYRRLDVVKLKREIDELVDQLWQDPCRS